MTTFVECQNCGQPTNRYKPCKHCGGRPTNLHEASTKSEPREKVSLVESLLGLFFPACPNCGSRRRSTYLEPHSIMLPDEVTCCASCGLELSRRPGIS